MAYTTLNELFVAIADAIRSKNNTNDAINAQDFPTKIRALTVQEQEEIVDDDKLYSFGVLSDIHMSQGGSTNMPKAMQFFKDEETDLVAISGDLVGTSINIAEPTEEFTSYKTAINGYDIPVYICKGNHDVTVTDSFWTEQTGCEPNFDFVHNGDAYIFVSLNNANSMYSNSTEPYSNSMAWLEAKLDEYKGARIFLFMHFPPSEYSGLITGQYYGYNQTSTEDDHIITLLNRCQNVAMFHGHTHYDFSCQGNYEKINNYQFEGNNVSLLHVPSTAYCRDTSWTTSYGISEGYIVDVYNDYFVVKAVDITNSTLLPDYVYKIDIPINSYASENAIIVDTDTENIKTGGTTTFSFHMSKKGATVQLTSNNSYVTFEPSTVVFTDENHLTPQTVTVTAKKDLGGELTALNNITLSSGNLTARTVSTTIVYVSSGEDGGDNSDTTGIDWQLQSSLTVADNGLYSGEYNGNVGFGVMNSSISGYNMKFQNLTVNTSMEYFFRDTVSTPPATIYNSGNNSIVSTGNRILRGGSFNFVGIGTNSLTLDNSSGIYATVEGTVTVDGITNLTIIDNNTIASMSGIFNISNGSKLTYNDVIIESQKVEGGVLKIGVNCKGMDSTLSSDYSVSVSWVADDGYTFSGWSVDGGIVHHSTASATLSPAQSHVFTAVFSKTA